MAHGSSQRSRRSSLLSKYLIRVNGRPLFNPSNFGLVLAFLVLGSRRVDPLEFWWVRPGIALALALTLIVVGGLFLAWRVKMLGLIASFWLTYAAALGVLAARGHCITARWHIGPVCNGYFWTVLVTSPEVARLHVLHDHRSQDRPPRADRTQHLRRGHRPRVRRARRTPTNRVRDQGRAPRRTRARLRDPAAPRTALTDPRFPSIRRSRPERHAGRRPARRSGASVRVIAVTAVAAVAYAALVVGAGAPASTSTIAAPVPTTPATCANRAATSTPRPRPIVRALAQPTVSVRDAINVSTRISPQVARRIVLDVIDDLAIAGDAISHRAPELAADVARFPWIDELITTICATNGPARRVELSDRSCDRDGRETDKRASLPRDRRRARRRRTRNNDHPIAPTPPTRRTHRPLSQHARRHESRRALARLREPHRPAHRRVHHRHVSRTAPPWLCRSLRV